MSKSVLSSAFVRLWRAPFHHVTDGIRVSVNCGLTYLVNGKNKSNDWTYSDSIVFLRAEYNTYSITKVIIRTREQRKLSKQQKSTIYLLLALCDLIFNFPICRNRKHQTPGNVRFSQTHCKTACTIN